MHRLIARLRVSALGAAVLIALRSSAIIAQAPSTDVLSARVQAVAGSYPIRGIELFGRDSVRLVVEDSSRTAKAVMEGRWMFGPPVTKEEAGGCPPEKVLGRRIAREFWRQRGKALAVEQVIVRVHGTLGLDRASYTDMYYGRADLDGPWIGDGR
jgi:hypothetical protein